MKRFLRFIVLVYMAGGADKVKDVLDIFSNKDNYAPTWLERKQLMKAKERDSHYSFVSICNTKKTLE